LARVVGFRIHWGLLAVCWRGLREEGISPSNIGTGTHTTHREKGLRSSEGRKCAPLGVTGVTGVTGKKLAFRIPRLYPE
jgi:hypothetical protein